MNNNFVKINVFTILCLISGVSLAKTIGDGSPTVNVKNGSSEITYSNGKMTARVKGKSTEKPSTGKDSPTVNVINGASTIIYK